MNIENKKPEFDKIIERTKTELGALRTSRATPALVENIQVEVYGARQSLKSLASLSVSDPRTLVIDPWDKSIVKEIEKAISAAGSGLNPVNEGKSLRIVLPSMTEESRKELVRLLSIKLEEGRVAVRTMRDKIRGTILEAEKKKEISEDERYDLQEELDKLSGEYNEQIKKIGEAKEKEIMQI
ncbi:MAG: ribosome recycling factor [Thermodesulfovibrionia bacterium]|nr:ribosome recycling factor [Thermodesulfovibrionia bacterium]